MTDPAGVIQICNQALSRIGCAQTITSLADSRPEAVQCNLWYAQCRDAMLRDFRWPWATTYAALNQVSANTAAVNQEWVYSYRYPTDCLLIRRLLYLPDSPVALTSQPPVFPLPLMWRQDADPYPIPFEVGQDDDGKLIYTDQINAWIKYTVAVTDPTQFPQDFASVLAWRLATELAYSLATSDSRREYALKQYRDELATSRANALNEEQRDNPYTTWNSEFIRARYGG